MKRYAGVLLPVTSLPSKYGIGCFDQAAYDFVDWLQKAGQRYWQILPLGATSYGSSDDSPYQAYSAFAGNPYLISLDALVEEGVLPADYDFEAHKQLVPMQPGDVPVTYADTTALQRDLGYKPATSLEDGLRAFAKWYKRYYNI